MWTPALLQLDTPDSTVSCAPLLEDEWKGRGAAVFVSNRHLLSVIMIF